MDWRGLLSDFASERLYARTGGQEGQWLVHFATIGTATQPWVSSRSTVRLSREVQEPAQQGRAWLKFVCLSGRFRFTIVQKVPFQFQPIHGVNARQASRQISTVAVTRRIPIDASVGERCLRSKKAARRTVFQGQDQCPSPTRVLHYCITPSFVTPNNHISCVRGVLGGGRYLRKWWWMLCGR
eukprot:m.391908 g.391908  ORF g.391908 m.391908 type:complete len:183 (+) comp16762_c0_seq12:3488-4036(+)